jgi:hypothetical protein
MASDTDDVKPQGDIIMKAIYKFMCKSMQQWRWVKGVSLQDESRELAQQRLNEIIRLAYGPETP